jgi:hypothetical protein
MSEDDLDAFFDEVEEVAEEANKEECETTSNTTSNGNGSTIAVADKSESDRPLKKARLELDVSYGAVSKGRVVVSKQAATISAPPVYISNNNASVSAAVSAAAACKEEIYQITVPDKFLKPKQNIPPPPPPPILPPYQYNTQQSSTSQTANGNVNANAKPAVRVAAGKHWIDPTLNEFPENDFRLFVGNLDSLISEQKLAEAFQSKYPSFAMCRIIYDKLTGESKGYAFVSVMDPKDCAKAIREMDQSWLGSRPIKVKLSDWKERDPREIRKGKKKKGRRR